MKATEAVLMSKCNHIFAWPFEFKWQEENVKDYARPFKEKGWEKKPMDIKKMRKDGKIDKDLFMLNQYLSSSAKDIFMQTGGDTDIDICTILKYPFKDGENWKYQIEIGEQKYLLPIQSVELHVYRHGVGILFIQTVNNEYPLIQDIKRINDYGRRISLPFLPDKPDGFMLCADEIGIVGERQMYLTNFRNIAKKCLNDECVEEKGLLESADFLYAFLNCRIGREATGKDFSSEEILPTADDRMHVFCLLRDDELSEKMRTMDWKHPRNRNEEEFQKLLYSIVFVDPGDPTCQNGEMRTEFLEKALYLRWQEWGTIYSVTNFSFFCLTGESPYIISSVLRPFITEYVYLLSLVLAQRIGIAVHSGKAGRIVQGVDKKGIIDKTQAETLINLQEKYITFKNQILILEASCQEQGIDIYHLLQNQMMVQEEQAILDEQLESLYEATNVSQGNRDTDKGLKWAIRAIVVDVIVNIIAIVADHGWIGLVQWFLDIVRAGM